jgi:hypothetical protein
VADKTTRISPDSNIYPPANVPPSAASAPVLAPPPVNPETNPGADAKPDGAVDDDAEARAAVLRARARYGYALEVDADNRKQQDIDIKFAWQRGAQWNADVRERRDSARRPWLEFNQTGQFIKQIVNDARQNKQAIDVRPEGNGASMQIAEIDAGLIRKIQYDSKAEAIYYSAFEQAVTGGRGYWRIVAEYEREDSFNQRLRVLPISNANAAILDPDAKEPDKCDARWGFVLDFLDRDAFEREWPLQREVVSWEMDSPTRKEWVDWYDLDKVCVADYFELVDEEHDLLLLPDGSTIWADELEQRFGSGFAGIAVTKTEKRTRTRCKWYKLTACELPLAVYDTPFKYVPIVMVPGDEMDVAGKRIYRGVVRTLRDPQMLYNYFFTAATECVSRYSRAPWIGIAGKFEGHAEWDDANVEDYSKLEYEAVELPDGTFDATPPQRNEPPPVPQSLVEMCAQCANLFREITGLKDPALGNHTQEQSGVAILARDAISDTATYHYVDNLARAIALTGRIMVDAIPRTYDTDRMIATLGIDGATDQVRINHPGGPGGALLNDLRVGSYAVCVDTGPSYQTKRLQAANAVVEFLGVVDPSQRPLITDLAASMIDAPDKLGDRMAARLFAALPPQVQMADIQSKSGTATPRELALMQALQQANTNSAQQMQALQQQLGQATQQIQQLDVLVLNKQGEIDQRREAAALDHAEAVRKSDIQELQVQLKAITELVVAWSKTGAPTAPAAVATAGAVETASQTVEGAPQL